MKITLMLIVAALISISQISVAGQLSQYDSFSVNDAVHADEKNDGEKKDGEKKKGGDGEEEPDCE